MSKREENLDYVFLDLGSKVNVMMRQTWAMMGKSKLIYSPIRIRMDNKKAVSPFGRLEHVPVDIDEVRKFEDFEVIEIVDDNCPYPALLGIDWHFNNSTLVDIKKRQMNFERDGLRFIAALDPDEGHCKKRGRFTMHKRFTGSLTNTVRCLDLFH
jgi:hypothetical protein